MKVSPWMSVTVTPTKVSPVTPTKVTLVKACHRASLGDGAEHLPLPLTEGWWTRPAEGPQSWAGGAVALIA